jgi:Domain of unknown function (DUF4342)
METENTHTITSDKTTQNRSKPKLAWTEEIEVEAGELVACVKRLAAEGQVSRVRIIDTGGDIILEMPLTIGAIAGGAVVLAAPILAIIGALAVFVTKVKLEIVRNGNLPNEKSNTQ